MNSLPVPIIIFIIVLLLFVAVCWIGNLVQLIQCDWSSTGTWKGEIVHTIGFVPIASIVTAWFPDR